MNQGLPPGKEDRRRPAGTRGHALFLVLLTVALFGGLSYAVSYSSFQAQQEEKLMMAAARITQFPAAIRTAVARMRAAGVDARDLDFYEEGTSAASVFYSGGGGVDYQKPPVEMGKGATWRFKTVAPDGAGWFVAGIAADDAAGKDVFAYLVDVPLVLCQEVNASLGLPPAPRVEPYEVNLAAPGAPDATAGNNAWTFSAHRREGRGATPSAACVQNGIEGPLVYYHVVAGR